MALRLYNTLTRTKEAFAPIDPAHVRMYVCGPTVYDFAHIGNARPIIVFDVLYRLLRNIFGPSSVTYVRNITDVDDKINARAAERGITIRQLTDETNAVFQADVKALGCLEPDVQPRATEHIVEMRDLIEKLVQKGFAYVAEDHVLFSPAAMDAARGKLPRYGALANRSLDEMIAGARVDVAPYKREATDFVLWKPSKEGEPSWASPCGIAVEGRPGWHIECSAMSWKRLIADFAGKISCEAADANVFDIHGGGIDLVFPHHENEIAQSCCALDAPRMANVWMHNGFLQVEGEKMSKSLGNFRTIRQLLASFPSAAIRWNMLKTHYRQPIDWTSLDVTRAQTELAGFARTIVNASVEKDYLVPDENLVDEQVLAALEDDLNTPAALTRIRALATLAEQNLGEDAKRFAATLGFMGFSSLDKPEAFLSGFASFGLQELSQQGFADLIAFKNFTNNGLVAAAKELHEKIVAEHKISPSVNENGALLPDAGLQYDEIDRLKDLRNKARAEKNWAESDRIRDELAAQGIILKDNKDGTTTWEVKR